MSKTHRDASDVAGNTGNNSKNTDRENICGDTGDVMVKSRLSRISKLSMLWYGIAVAVLLVDQMSKYLAVHYIAPQGRIPIIGHDVSFMVVYNSGAAFSLATGRTYLLTMISIIIAVGIARYLYRLSSRGSYQIRTMGIGCGLALVLGGAMGNLYDRFFRSPGFFHGYVVDFISVGWWPVFNCADSAICCGVCILFVVNILSHHVVSHNGAAEE